MADDTTPAPMTAEEIERVRRGAEQFGEYAWVGAARFLATLDAKDAEIARLRELARAIAKEADAFKLAESMKAAEEHARATAAEARLAEAEKALGFYASPEVYRPHPDGLGFDDRDLSYVARAFLAKGGSDAG